MPGVWIAILPNNEQHLFFLMWQWMALWWFFVFIINLWPSLLITGYQLLLPTTPSAHPWELMVQATFSIFPFSPFLYTLHTLPQSSCMTSHKVCIWLIFGFSSGRKQLFKNRSIFLKWICNYDLPADGLV